MFLDLDEAKINKAILKVETETTAKIIVHVRPKASRDILKAAQNYFHQTQLSHSQHHANVLIFIAAENHALAIYADHGIHQLVNPTFWHEQVQALQAAFKKGSYNAGLVAAIKQIGTLLQEKFPA
jgi:uncharacterized membrane protein